MLGVLVELFGRDAVEQALATVASPKNGTKVISHAHKRTENGRSSLRSAHEHVHEMRGFLDGLERGQVLPEAEDVRQFASIAGIKRLHGRSRRDLLRGLLRALDTMPSERVVTLLREAPHVTAAVRSEGFAVLTDKLLENIVDKRKGDVAHKPERRR